MHEPKLDIVSFIIGFFVFSLLALFFGYLGFSYFAKAFIAAGEPEWHQHVPYFFFLFLPLLAGLAGGLHTSSKKNTKYKDTNHQTNAATPIKKIGDCILYFLLGCICISGLYISYVKLNS